MGTFLVVSRAHGWQPAAGASAPISVTQIASRSAIAATGTGFPNAATTGVPAGTVLRAVPGQVSSGPGWYFDRRGWVEVYGDRALLKDLYIPYNVNISASNVTIDGVQVVNGGGNAIGISLRNARDVTIEHSTISGTNTVAGRAMAGIKDVYGDSSDVSVLYDNISMAETGVQIEAGVISSSYIHDPGYLPGDHVNGVTSNGGGSASLTITHNTIMINRPQTDAIGLFEDFGVQRNRVIADNLLAGGGYTIYAGQNPGGPIASNIIIRGNQISTVYYRHGGYYGCLTNFNAAGPGDVWSGNISNAVTDLADQNCG